MIKRTHAARRRRRGLRRVPARPAGGLGGRAAGRGLPAGHDGRSRAQLATSSCPQGAPPSRDRGEHHARPDPAGRRAEPGSCRRASGATSVFGELRRGRRLRSTTVGRDVVAGGEQSRAPTSATRRSGTTSLGQGEESGADHPLRSTVAHDVQAARPRRRHAPRERREHRARLRRVEAADGADGAQLWPEHARRPGEGRARLHRRRWLARLPVRVRRPLQPETSGTT